MRDPIQFQQLRDSVKTALGMQLRLNQTIHPQWDTQPWSYSRAVWLELAELADHYGWKWWAKQERDLRQCKIEIVDMFHMMISGLLRAFGGDKANLDLMSHAITCELEDYLHQEQMADSFLWQVDRMASFYAALSRDNADPDIDGEDLQVCMEYLGNLMGALPLSWAELHSLYIAKNALNFFRQAKGYKTGEYDKVWLDGREDNEHMMDIVDSYPAEQVLSPDFESMLTRDLENAHRAQSN